MNVKIGSTLLVLAGVAPFPLISQDWPMLGGTAQRNMASAMMNLPESWDVKSDKNIKWKAQIGSTSFGNPVVADGKIFLGTNNGNPRKFLPGLSWVEIELSTEEENADAVVLKAPEAAGVGFDGLDL
jgi:outer membrane protein assembly factor BamB